MLVVTGSNTNHQTGNVIFFFTEAHAFRVLAEHHARFQYAIFCFNRTVWHRDRLTQISRGQFFTIQHRLNVFRLNVTAFHQLLASKTNRFFFGCRFATEEDVLRAQFEQVSTGIVKAVFQTVFHFHFVFSMALGSNQTFGQAGVQAAVEEVGQRNMLCLRNLAHSAFGQVTVSDDQVHIWRQVVDRAVSDRNLRQTCILNFLTQHTCAHRTGTHTGITGNDDFTYVAQVVSHIARRQRRRAFRLSFHVLHTTSCCFNIIFFFHFAGFQQNGRDNEGDSHRRTHTRDVSEVCTFWCHRQYSKDRTRRCRRNQTTAQDSQREHASHTTEDNGQNQTRIHQHIREVDFVDTAQEVDDCRTARRLFSATTTKEHVRQQHAHTRTWVSFNQEEDGFTQFMGLLNAQRREDTVVNGVVEEQDFRRFNKDRRQRQHVMDNHEVNARSQHFGQGFNNRANAEECQNSEDHPDDACGEVIHQHLKTGFDLTVYPAVEVLNAPAAQRTCNHRAEEHRHVCADDNAHGGNGTDYAATFAAYQLTTGITDQQRQEISDHRPDQLRQRFVR